MTHFILIYFIILSSAVVLNFSLQFDGDLNQVLFDAASSESEESLDTLRHAISERGGDANARTHEGESVLHLACIYGDVEKVKLLLEYGADPNYRASLFSTSLDMTPLTWCAYGNHVLAVEEILASARTKVNLVVGSEDGAYITALDIAFKVFDGKNRDLINILQNAGAKTFQQLLIQYKAECSIPGMPDSYLHSNCLD